MRGQEKKPRQSDLVTIPNLLFLPDDVFKHEDYCFEDNSGRIHDVSKRLVPADGLEHIVEDLEINKIVPAMLETVLPEGEKDRWGGVRDSIPRSSFERYFIDFLLAADTQDAAQQRIDVLQYFHDNQGAYEKTRGLFEDLLLLYQGFRERDERSKLVLLGTAGKIINEYTPYSDNAPEMFQLLNATFENLRKSRVHKKVQELADKLSGKHDVTIRVQYDPGESTYDAAKVVSLSVTRPKNGAFEWRVSTHNIDRCDEHIDNVVDKLIGRVYSRFITNMDEQIKQLRAVAMPLSVYLSSMEYAKKTKKKIQWSLPKYGKKTDVVGMKHPLVEKQPVGNSLPFSHKIKGISITGPNECGKTTFARASGLVYLAARKGILGPAERIYLPYPGRVLTHFPQRDSTEEGKSTFRMDMERSDEIFNIVRPGDITIFDEPVGGTDQIGGDGLTADFADVLINKVGAQVILTTHMRSLGKFLTTFSGMEQFHFDYDDNQQPTYVLQDGPCQRDYALTLPEKMGLTKEPLLARIEKRRVAEGW